MKQVFKIIVGVGVASLLFSVAFGIDITRHSAIHGTGSIQTYNVVNVKGPLTLTDTDEADSPMSTNVQNNAFGTIQLTTNTLYSSGNLKMRVDSTSLKHGSDTMNIGMLPCPSDAGLLINTKTNAITCSEGGNGILSTSDKTFTFAEIFFTTGKQTEGSAKGIFTGRIFAASTEDAYQYTIGSYSATITLTLTLD